MKRLRPLHSESEEVGIRQILAGEGVVVIDQGFEVIAFDHGAEAILNDLGGNDSDGRELELPAEIREHLRGRSLADLASMKLGFYIGNHQYSCDAFLVESLNGGMPRASLALHLKRATSVDDALKEVAEDYHLTKREREALEGLSLGLSSKALAERMQIAHSTVNSFLRLIMVKMGVNTRAGIIGKLLEQNSGAGVDDVRAPRGGRLNAS